MNVTFKTRLVGFGLQKLSSLLPKIRLDLSIKIMKITKEKTCEMLDVSVGEILLSLASLKSFC